MNLLQFALSVALWSATSSCATEEKCGGTDSCPNSQTKVASLQFENYPQAKDVLDRNCVPCHKARNFQGDVRYDTYDFVAKHALLGATCIEGNCPAELKVMPPFNEDWTSEEKSALIDWLKAGAPNP